MLGKGLLGDCKPILTLLKYEGKIRSFAGSNFSRHSSHVMKDNCPRYVRVNTLKTSLSNVQYQLDNNGWSLQEYDPTQVTYSDFLKFIQASCLPVLVSGIKPGSNVIDACAAPGNKTSYIAAAINNTGHVVAIEKDLERYQTLQRLVVERRATCVTTLNQDFTRLPLDKYSQVEFIFVDPSCSSSGVNLHNDEVPEERIRSLACFQAHLLRHALSFPSVQEVIYSTCSVYVQENEEVVQNALKEFQDQFELEDLSEKLSGWKHFGNESFVFGRRCLRTRTDVDKCHGFFVAKFVRISKICNRLTSVNKIDKKRKQQKSFKNLEIVSGNSKNLESKLSEVVTCAKKKQKVKR
nr:28S rRNA (cytosine-C(5))-methyltransferase-like [Cherax quadricarinatus]